MTAALYITGLTTNAAHEARPSITQGAGLAYQARDPRMLYWKQWKTSCARIQPWPSAPAASAEGYMRMRQIAGSCGTSPYAPESSSIGCASAYGAGPVVVAVPTTTVIPNGPIWAA